jgi:aspartate kinase
VRIFKFGGASIINANGIKNLVKVLKHEGVNDTLLVISAMGKMTNAFENIIHSYCKKDNEVGKHIDFVRNYHVDIVSELFEKSHNIYLEIEVLLGQLSGFLVSNKNKDYNFIYDQVVGFGELLSTKIVSAYLNEGGIENTWIDVRNYIKTNSNFREALVDWDQTEKEIKTLEKGKLLITQGFLGSNTKNETTTLGREGSDFTAAIFGHCLNAKSVTIWKDVKGVLNADPRFFQNVELLHHISYNEAIEMAFYGASVIHPKTLKPLQNKQIPLYVRSFNEVNIKGTLVSEFQNEPLNIPCFILKQDQILVSVSTLDFSFMVESNLSHIFETLHKFKLKVNLIQNSAISFSVCIEDKYANFDQFVEELMVLYKINFYKNVELYTIRHATKKAVAEVEEKGSALLKQVTTETVQIVMKSH